MKQTPEVDLVMDLLSKLKKSQEELEFYKGQFLRLAAESQALNDELRAFKQSNFYK